MRKSKLRLLGAAMSAGVLSVAVAACGTGSSSGSSSSSGGSSSKSASMQTGPGVDASTKTITLGVLSPLSGPVQVIGGPLTAGNQAYFNYVNATGGINGWKIKLDEQDTKYDPQTEVQEFNQIQNNVAFLAQSLGSPTTSAIQPMVDQLKMITGAAAQDSLFTSDPVMAVIGTPYAVDDANAVYYIERTKHVTNAKLGIIYQDDAYGQDGLRGFNAGVKAYGGKVVAEATYKATDTDFTAQVEKMKAAGANYVFLVAVPNAAATIVGTAASGGYSPQWVFQGPAWSEYLMSVNGLPGGKPTPVAPALAGHVWVLGYEAQWGDTSTPGMSTFLANTKKYAPKEIPDYYYEYGYCEAEVETAIIKKAIASNNLTRQGLLNAKLNLGTVNLDGLMPNVTYTPTPGPADRETEISVVSPSVPGFLKNIQPFFESSAAQSLSFKSSS